MGSVLVSQQASAGPFFKENIMCNNENLEFTCRECGAHELSYQKYAKCTTPVSLKKDGHIEYGQSIFDDDDYLATLNGFACKSCGRLVEHCGFRMESERQLIDYLTMDPQVRQQQQSEYDELLDAQSYQEQDAWAVEAMSAAEKLALAD